MIQTIEASTNTTITIGQNGLIILKSDNDVDLKKAIALIKMMDKTLDDTNLEECIQNILDEKN
ncbi:putative exosome complex RNA-binding protein 1 [Marine Group I thaumarchaeote SCGC AAA799-O18]|nr:putative exosome complex RNA-binding protein 1 [Marine Group I thaumarchaeote SCGC AAA799-O18]